MGFLALVIPSVLLFAALVVRIWAILPGKNTQKAQKRSPSSTCSLGVFLGSGGHTAEMRTLLSTLDYARYTPRKYVLCHGDEMSLRMIAQIEGEHETGEDVERRQQAYDIVLLPRARKVGQSILSSALSTLYTIMVTIHHLFLLPLLDRPTQPWVDVLLLNGPGTCVVLVLVSYIRRIFGLSYTKIIYVESFARVKTLSLSAKLLKPFVDKMVVQWPDMGGAEGRRVDYRGWLV